MAKVTGLLLLDINRFVSEQKMKKVLLKAVSYHLKVCVAPIMIFFKCIYSFL